MSYPATKHRLAPRSQGTAGGSSNLERHSVHGQVDRNLFCVCGTDHSGWLIYRAEHGREQRQGLRAGLWRRSVHDGIDRSFRPLRPAPFRSRNAGRKAASRFFPELLRGAYLELLAGASSRVRFTLRRTRLSFWGPVRDQRKLRPKKKARPRTRLRLGIAIPVQPSSQRPIRPAVPTRMRQMANGVKPRRETKSKSERTTKMPATKAAMKPTAISVKSSKESASRFL